MDAVLSPPMSHVPSLVGELRSYKLCGATNKIKINKILTNGEVDMICLKNGISPQKREV